ncbi:MAG: cytochrome C oxidase subunit IV family protein [Bdellovibrio sp.]|nr:cytochrome C oxidase subunit IV family protein [Bdellovibrio sp.]
MNKEHVNKHYILSTKNACLVGVSLLILTVITVLVAGINLGRLNFIIAFLIATIKGTLVALFFMNLKHDRKENTVIFLTSFVFLAVFIVLTVSDLFFRGDVYVKGQLGFAQAELTSGTIKQPWISTPELIAKGKIAFSIQCVACHGAEGQGNGPAAAALKPPPRNFTSQENWKLGRKPSQVFKTIRDGIPNSAMSSFSTIPNDDRWALVHYVLSLGPKSTPKPTEDTNEDLAKIGIDPSKQTAGSDQTPSITIDFAMQRMIEEAKNKR